MSNDPQNIPPVDRQNDWDWRDERHARREARWEARQARRSSPANAWIGGAILILLGIVFLMQNLTGFTLENWWALFILIPAIGSLATAWSIYTNNGRRFTMAVRGPLIGGFFLAMLAFAFLFNISLTIAIPVLMIAAGVVLLVSWLLPG